MKSIGKIILLLMMLLNTSLLFAQDNKVEMADTMRSNGKIYIVVAVCLTILVGLFIYVWSVDRKIGRLEKES
jgi:EamA domain-containing membrane protein RarD